MTETTRTPHAPTACPRCAAAGWLRVCPDCGAGIETGGLALLATIPVPPPAPPEIVTCDGCGESFDLHGPSTMRSRTPEGTTHHCARCTLAHLESRRAERPAPRPWYTAVVQPANIDLCADGRLVARIAGGEA